MTAHLTEFYYTGNWFCRRTFKKEVYHGPDYVVFCLKICNLFCVGRLHLSVVFADMMRGWEVKKLLLLITDISDIIENTAVRC